MEHIQKSAKSSIKLTLTKEAATLTDSKVGGKPWLPPQMPYPQDEDGNDYLFLAQINWAQMPQLDGYPASGLTSFFVKEDDTFGLMDLEGDNYDYYVSWGDSGVGNFFIRREDMLHLDFSKVSYTWDCL
ncbi:DUF1963 domain-containing protein [Brevibacillus brevis]|uniref:DUF1963 domain-containing protein n=1 Tax=Brevibacillus brevis TaxID=1393 RepID=UPI00192D56EE|nr:DUF1963 domain-containing protein [Brevibacillus brevis]